MNYNIDKRKSESFDTVCKNDFNKPNEQGRACFRLCHGEKGCAIAKAFSQPLLTAKQEVELVSCARRGDTVALQMLYNRNLRFIVSVAKQYQHRGMTLARLIEVGKRGIVQAIRMYDHQGGIRFIAYAIWHIRESIIIALSAIDR